jgi:hypothetical protein
MVSIVILLLNSVTLYIILDAIISDKTGIWDVKKCINISLVVAASLTSIYLIFYLIKTPKLPT